jgi:hypothetical protein
MRVTPESPEPPDLTQGLSLIRFARPLLVISLAALVLTTIAQVWITWRADSMMDDVAGIWSALAADMRNGIFYRPLYGPLGYGGTRYFPLHFAIHAGLMKAGLNVVVAGRCIELFSLVILLAGTYLLLRGLGVETWLAVGAALLVLATPSGQVLLVVRGDVLPASLNILGLALCVRQVPSRWRLCASSFLFTLAFAAKPTTVFGSMTLIIAFLVGRRFKLAGQLLAMILAGYGLVLAAIYFGSQGRAFEIFRACALGGGSWRFMLRGPMRMAMEAAGARPQNGVVFIILGFAALLAWKVDWANSIPPVFLVLTALVSAAIMGTPGADGNHLLDLYVASIILFVTWLKNQSRSWMSFGICILAAATLFVLPEQLDSLWYKTATELSNRRDSRQILRVVGDIHKPILAENPLVCIQAGQIPYLLDPNNFRVINERNPSFAEPLWKKIRGQSFSAVVLILDPQSDTGHFWYKSVHFGPGFTDELYGSYYLAARICDQFVFLPRKG